MPLSFCRFYYKCFMGLIISGAIKIKKKKNSESITLITAVRKFICTNELK